MKYLYSQFSGEITYFKNLKMKTAFILKWKILFQIKVNILHFQNPLLLLLLGPVSVNGINNVRVSRMQIPQSYHLWCLSTRSLSHLCYPFHSHKFSGYLQSFWTPHFLLFPLFNPQQVLQNIIRFDHSPPPVPPLWLKSASSLMWFIALIPYLVSPLLHPQ